MDKSEAKASPNVRIVMKMRCSLMVAVLCLLAAGCHETQDTKEVPRCGNGLLETGEECEIAGKEVLVGAKCPDGSLPKTVKCIEGACKIESMDCGSNSPCVPACEGDKIRPHGPPSVAVHGTVCPAWAIT